MSTTPTLASDQEAQSGMSVQTRQMFHMVAMVELYQAQIEVAKYLELGYLAVADHPDVARDVRMTAHKCRTQHMMSSGLMKSFMVTAAHIVETLMPQILDGVDLLEPSIVEATFDLIIELAQDMKTEALATKAEYYKIQTMVQQNLASVNERNRKVKDREAKLKQETEAELLLARDARLAEEELKAEQAEMEEELDNLRNHRDVWMDKMEKFDDEARKEDAKTFLDPLLVPALAVSGPAGAVAAAVHIGINVFSSVLGAYKRNKESKRLTDAYESTEKSVERVAVEKREVMAKKQERRKDALERCANIRKMTQERAGLGDARSLMEASAGLGEVDRQFIRIIRLWENIVVMLKLLQAQTKAGEVYLKKIENPRLTERFKGSIDKAEKGWKAFGRICSDYVTSCERDEVVSIQALYKFLSDPIDNMAADRRATRMREIEYEIQENIEG